MWGGGKPSRWLLGACERRSRCLSFRRPSLVLPDIRPPVDFVAPSVCVDAPRCTSGSTRQSLDQPPEDLGTGGAEALSGFLLAALHLHLYPVDSDSLRLLGQRDRVARLCPGSQRRRPG